MSFDTQDFNNLNVISPFAGDALLFPNGLREPGVLSAHKGHFGQGSTVIPFTAALVAGPSSTTPLTWNSARYTDPEQLIASHVVSDRERVPFPEPCIAHVRNLWAGIWG